MFSLEINGTYLPGYGVAFRLPNDLSAPFFISIGGGSDNRSVRFDRNENGISYTITTHDEEGVPEEEDSKQMKLKDKSSKRKKDNMDSLRDDYNTKLIQAAKDFIIDYGDFISQLGANEKIIVTNQGEHNKGWYFTSTRRTHLSIEGSKSDITAFKQGKITRDQAEAKLRIVNTEALDEKAPDMELISTIFGRLYSADLSKTFFTEDNIYYEMLKDYGVIYYMQVFSSNQSRYSDNRVNMPTVGLEDVDMQTRDKKVIELYPKFEQELKDNILEYGRTIKSLKDEEIVVFNVTMTKCRGCNIPSSVELTIKAGVLKELAAGKIDKKTAEQKFIIKKGPNQ
jgi:hypothetical protein